VNVSESRLRQIEDAARVSNDCGDHLRAVLHAGR